MSKRKTALTESETKVLIKSHRKCCYCFGLENKLETKAGQIAHLDRNNSNSKFDNLAYMCFDHHHQYDSTSKQAKGFTEKEAKHYRDMLYKLLSQNYEAKIGKYQYRYFQKTTYSPSYEDLLAETNNVFLNNLDLMKLKADQLFVKENAEKLDAIRLRTINDYVFKIYKYTWFIQLKWREINGRFFQGKNTMLDVPNYEEDGKVSKYFGLTDQVDDWEDIGYDEEFAPVQVRCDVYDGPQGQGYTVIARVIIEDILWENKMHQGPEQYRNPANFEWIELQKIEYNEVL